ncbi:MAG TPA: PQQ-dependent sugar dehydrogenase, partial [Bacteroidia bacterium]|nr:PQQ-dependent sugar dehydrogenase [Bacteroidia bacterium]
MKKIIFGVLVLSLSLLHNLSAQVMIGTQAVDTATIIGKLHVPWEILWGPDDYIWFTERNGQVRRLNPVTKTSKIILKMTDVVQQSESGLLGMALHPNFND